jgi:hypothetical protein
LVTKEYQNLPGCIDVTWPALSTQTTSPESMSVMDIFAHESLIPPLPNSLL